MFQDSRFYDEHFLHRGEERTKLSHNNERVMKAQSSKENRTISSKSAIPMNPIRIKIKIKSNKVEPLCKLIKIIRKQTKDEKKIDNKIQKGIEKVEKVYSYFGWFVNGVHWHAISVWSGWRWVFLGGICVRRCAAFGIRWTSLGGCCLRIDFFRLRWLWFDGSQLLLEV